MFTPSCEHVVVDSTGCLTVSLVLSARLLPGSDVGLPPHKTVCKAGDQGIVHWFSLTFSLLLCGHRGLESETFLCFYL